MPQEWSVEKVSTKMLAAKIGVSASTASESIRKLAEQGLVDHEKYGAVTLTEAGAASRAGGSAPPRLLETFLVNELGYGWDEVHDEAEVLEHAVSGPPGGPPSTPSWGTRSATHMATRSRPPTGRFRRRRPVSWWVCGDGDTATVARISDADPEMLRYFRQRRDPAGLPDPGPDPARIRRHDLGRDRVGRRRRDHRGLGQPRRPGGVGRGLARSARRVFTRRVSLWRCG